MEPQPRQTDLTVCRRCFFSRRRYGNGFSGGNDDTISSRSFAHGFCNRFGRGASARYVREQGNRKRRPRARRRCANRLPRQMQARNVRAQGDRIERQAAQRSRENELHGEVPEGAGLSGIIKTIALAAVGEPAARMQTAHFVIAITSLRARLRHTLVLSPLKPPHGAVELKNYN